MLHPAERPGVAATRVLPGGDLGGSGLVYDDGRGPIGVVEVLVGKRYCLCHSVEARKGEHGYNPGNLSLMLHHGYPSVAALSPHADPR